MKRIVVLSDIQAPEEDAKLVTAVQHFVKDYAPDELFCTAEVISNYGFFYRIVIPTYLKLQVFCSIVDVIIRHHQVLRSAFKSKPSGSF